LIITISLIRQELLLRDRASTRGRV